MTGGTGGDGGAGGEIVPSCPPETQLTLVDTPPLFARYGTVFSSTLYTPNQEDTHQPVPVTVRAEWAGEPVPGCRLQWAPGPNSGWVYPTAPETDAQGQIDAWWVAGDVPMPTVEVTTDSGMGLTVTATAEPSPRTRTNSVHLNYGIDGPYDEVTVSVEPRTGPSSTYYSTLNWPGAYAGIQFDDWNGRDMTMVLFSVWDVDGRDAILVDDGAANQVVEFGGEGTGRSLRLRFPPAEHGAITGLPDDYMLQTGHVYETHLQVTAPAECDDCTDYTVRFTDHTRGLGPIVLGTLRFGQRVVPDYAAAFVEDWLDRPGDHCLNSGERSAYFHAVRHRRGGGEWTEVNRARFTPNYVPGNNEICANYGARVEGQRFFMSSGGQTERIAPLMRESIWLSL